LFADVPQPLLTSTGVLTRNQPHVRADLLAALKPRRRRSVLKKVFDTADIVRDVR
jgi:hypothetical protein